MFQLTSYNPESSQGGDITTANRPRWLRLLVGVLAVSMLGGLLLAWIWNQIPRIGEEDLLGSNVGVVILINANIVLVMLLGFVVFRNLIKLLLDRRRAIPGARLRTRLVAAFVGLSLIPTVLLFFVAKGIVGNVLQDWFSPQVSETVEAALEVSRLHYQLEAEQLQAHLRGVRRAIRELDLSRRGITLDASLRQLVSEYALDAITLVSPDGEVVLESTLSRVPATELPPPAKTSVQQALLGGEVVEPEQYGDWDLLRAYGRLERAGVDATPVVVMLSVVMPADLSPKLEAVVGNYDSYRELRSYKTPIISSYYLTLVVVTLLIVFSAIWVGFYLAKSLSGPIHELASGTVEVAHGNLAYRIPAVGDDELGLLVRSFNMMTADLQKLTGELVARRRYMETVLESIGVGVMSVDDQRRVTTINSAGITILGLSGRQQAAEGAPTGASGLGSGILGKQLAELFVGDFGERVQQMLVDLLNSSEHMFISTFSLAPALPGYRPRPESSTVESPVREQPGLRQIAVTINKLQDEQGVARGAVLLFDDVTTLVSAQRVAAWREVARRIAHEIKNPLTPLQLSAQRLQRKFGGERKEVTEEDRQVIVSCCDVIVRQVETLRDLIDEFSKFARLPKTKLQQAELNPLVSSVVEQYARLFPEIKFSSAIESNLPPLQLDLDQLRRVLTNLLDNAIASIRERAAREGGRYQGEIVFRTSFEESVGLAVLSVADNGVGVNDEEKGRIFEPYFSKKVGGTGLGLAIVNHIIADHGAFIRVYDSQRGGATFVIEFPVPEQLLKQQEQRGWAG